MRSSVDNTREVILFREWVIEVADGVDGVKQAKEVYFGFRTAKGSLEAVHIFLGLIHSLEPTSSHRVFLISSIRKRYHLLIPVRQQANGGDHPGQESSGESTSGETEHEDFIILFVKTHDEPISSKVSPPYSNGDRVRSEAATTVSLLISCTAMTGRVGCIVIAGSRH